MATRISLMTVVKDSCRAISQRGTGAPPPPMGPHSQISRLISDVWSFSMVFVLGFNPIRVRVMCVEESQLGFANCDRTKRRLSSR